MSKAQVVRLNPERLSVRVAKCLRDFGPRMVGPAVAAKLGEPEARVKAALYRLERDGCCERHGKYPAALWEYRHMPARCGMRPMAVKRGNKFVMPPAPRPATARAVEPVAPEATSAKHVPSNPMATKRRPITELWELCQRDPMPESRAAVWTYIR